MAGSISNGNVHGNDYQGLDSIFEFTNDDGKLDYFNCGQAAAATLLCHLGQFPAEVPQARDVMDWIETYHPPDNLAGYFGSSRRRVIRICKAKGVRLQVITGEEALRKELDQGRPVILMLGTVAGKLWKFDLPGGHWVVAYGYDDANVYLSNWGCPLPWTELRVIWHSLVSRLNQMNNRGLVAVPQG